MKQIVEFAARSYLSDDGEKLIEKRIVKSTVTSSLYFFKNQLGLVKIGKSYKPATRKKTIEAASGMRVEVINVIKNGGSFEADLHAIYSEYRKIGEWFALPDKEIHLLKMLTLKKLKVLLDN